MSRVIYKGLVTAFLLSSMLIIQSVYWQDKTYADDFLGVEIDLRERTYVVTRDVNVRAKPDTKSKRIAGLKKGQRVSVVGRHQGWLAIMRESKPFGFAYFKYLVPLLEGSLDKPVSGKANINGDGSCEYEITYSGKSTTETTLFGMADYEVNVECNRGENNYSFILFMFMTEGAYKTTQPNLHQIGIDLLEIDTIAEYDKIFSTNIFYNSKNANVIFDEVIIKEYSRTLDEESHEAQEISDVLKIAVGMALRSWSNKAWDDLEKSLRKGES